MGVVTQEINARLSGRREEIRDFFQELAKETAGILETELTDALKEACAELIEDWKGCSPQENWGDLIREIMDRFQQADEAKAMKIAVKLNNYYIETDNDRFLENLANDFSFWDQLRLMVYAHLEHCLSQMKQKGSMERIKEAAADWDSLSNKDVNTLICAALNILPGNLKNSTQVTINQWFANGWDEQPNTVEVSREIMFRLAFALQLDEEEVTQLLTLGLKRDLFHPKNYGDMIHKYCFKHRLSYEQCAAMLDTCAGYILDKGVNAFNFYPIGGTMKEQRGTLEMGSSIDQMIDAITDPNAFVQALAAELTMNMESFAEHLASGYRGPSQDEAEKQKQAAEACRKKVKELEKSLKKLQKAKDAPAEEIAKLEEEIREQQDKAAALDAEVKALEAEAAAWAVQNTASHLAKVKKTLDPDIYAELEAEIGQKSPKYEKLKNSLKKGYINANSVCRRNFVQSCLQQYGMLLRGNYLDTSELAIFLQNLLMAGDASDAQLTAALLNDDTSHYVGDLDAGKQLLTAEYLKGICEGTENVRRTDIFRLALLQEFFVAKTTHTERTFQHFRETVDTMLSQCLYPCYYSRSADDRFFALCYASKQPLNEYHELMYKEVLLRTPIADTLFPLSDFILSDQQWAALRDVLADTIPEGMDDTCKDWLERILCLGTNGLPWSKFDRVQKEDGYTEGNRKDVQLIRNWFKQVYKQHRDELAEVLQGMRELLHMKDPAEVLDLVAKNLKMETEEE